MIRWRILQIGKTEVSVHPAVFVYLLYTAITGHLLFTLVAYVSIILHEAAHAMMATLLGQQPNSVEISPLGAVMRLEEEEHLPPVKRLCVIAAGPAISLVLCWASVLFHTPIRQALFLSNLSIVLMNLLPVLPLDGGRLLMLLLERYIAKPIATQVIKCISIAVGAGLIMLNVWYSWKYGGWNLSMTFAGCCIIYSASVMSVTSAMAEMRYFLDRKIMLERKGRIHTLWVTVQHNVPISILVRYLPPGKLVVFACAEAGTGRIIGYIHELALIQIYMTHPGILLNQAVIEHNLIGHRTK